MLLDAPRVSRISFRDGGDRSGIVIRTDGRLCVIDSGAGLSVQLDSARLREISRRCITVAAVLAEQEAAAADEAGADLARIAAGSGNA